LACALLRSERLSTRDSSLTRLALVALRMLMPFLRASSLRVSICGV
jgi:hypothetical protein